MFIISAKFDKLISLLSRKQRFMGKRHVDVPCILSQPDNHPSSSGKTWFRIWFKSSYSNYSLFDDKVIKNLLKNKYKKEMNFRNARLVLSLRRKAHP